MQCTNATNSSILEDGGGEEDEERGSDADVSGVSEDTPSTAALFNGGVAAAAWSTHHHRRSAGGGGGGGAELPRRSNQPRPLRAKAGGSGSSKRSIRRRGPLATTVAPRLNNPRGAGAAAVAAAELAQAEDGSLGGGVTSDLDASRLEACRRMYRTLPRQSRYAQHRLRVLGRAIELLAISRPSRTAEQQRDLDEALRGLKL